MSGCEPGQIFDERRTGGRDAVRRGAGRRRLSSHPERPDERAIFVALIVGLLTLAAMGVVAAFVLARLAG